MKTKPPPTTTTGERIRAERIRLGLTQQQCARRLGISRGSFQQLEEATNPKLGTLVTLSDGLGMDLRRIVPELFETWKAAGKPEHIGE